MDKDQSRTLEARSETAAGVTAGETASTTGEIARLSGVTARVALAAPDLVTIAEKSSPSAEDQLVTGILAYQEERGYTPDSWENLRKRYEKENDGEVKRIEQDYINRCDAAKSKRTPEGSEVWNMEELNAAGREYLKRMSTQPSRNYQRMLGCPVEASVELTKAALNLFRRRQAEQQFRQILRTLINALRDTKSEGEEWTGPWNPQVRLSQRGFSSDDHQFFRYLVNEEPTLNLQGVHFPTRFYFIEGPAYRDDMTPIDGAMLGYKIPDCIDQATMRRIANEMVAETGFSHDDFDFLKRPPTETTNGEG